MTETQQQPQAPFIPPSPDSEPIPPKPWQVFHTPGFPQLFSAQVISSIGDWTGLVAILAIASHVSTNAVGFVMVARMLPGFLLAPVAGAFLDRWNRKVVMVTCDIGRAALLAVLPFWANVWGLVVLSFAIEILTLLWGPAKDASVPNVVRDPDQLPAANSLGLVAAFGMMPVGAILFGVLAAVSTFLGNFHALAWLQPKQSSLAIWVDALTFVGSAILISRLALPKGHTTTKTSEQPGLRQTWRDIVEGLSFIRGNPLVRGVMIGLAGGLLGGGSIVPLGAIFSKDVLGGTASGFGFLTAALGVGCGIGVVTLLWLQRRLPRAALFCAAITATGVAIILVACVSTLALAILLVAFVGACAGCAYVTGFTLLQESVSDEMRGRTFATLYTVVRLCLLLSLTIGPFVAAGLGALSGEFTNGQVKLGGAHLSLPGVRLALWLGGVLTVASGLAARRRMRKAKVEVNTA
ncbi:MAG TPA: MFS transporter [Acidimicrobiia bacterium]|nr:MFS transporter [Acidimicrobiia bacterium]